MRYELEDGLMPFAPGFELVERTERLVEKVSGVIVFCASSPKAFRSAQPHPSGRTPSVNGFHDLGTPIS